MLTGWGLPCADCLLLFNDPCCWLPLKSSRRVSLMRQGICCQFRRSCDQVEEYLLAWVSWHVQGWNVRDTEFKAKDVTSAAGHATHERPGIGRLAVEGGSREVKSRMLHVTQMRSVFPVYHEAIRINQLQECRGVAALPLAKRKMQSLTMHCLSLLTNSICSDARVQYSSAVSPLPGTSPASISVSPPAALQG